MTKTVSSKPAGGRWAGATRVLTTAHEFERAGVQAATEETLVLCDTARLARRLLHRYRQSRQSAGNTGWETPSIRSFRGWVRDVYDFLWPACRPLTPAIFLKLWHTAVADEPLPEGLMIQPDLYRQMQDSLDALLDKKLDPVGRTSNHPLADFRRQATRRFLALIKKEKVALWSDMFREVCQAIVKGRVALPPQTILMGNEDPSPLKIELLTAIAKRSRVTLIRLPAEPVPRGSVRLYATPGQECRAISAEVLHAWNNNKQNLGVVVADRAYTPLLKRCFDELAGTKHPDFEKAIRYNLAQGIPLSEHPLFQTAILPLRILAEPVPVPLLTSLFTSPYVRNPEANQVKLIRSLLWDPDHSLSLVEACRALAVHGFPMMPFQRLASRPTASLSRWLDGMKVCLAELGFCRFEGQHRATDALAHQHLDKIITALKQEAGELVMDNASALAWLSAAVAGIIVSEKTSEITGIQILNLAEAQGLAFEQLWVVGLHGTVLPPPAREWPFLDPDEQQIMEGGTPEQQWTIGQQRLAGLQATAPETNFSRAAAGNDEVPYLPCPLIPDECKAEGQPIQHTFDLWKTTSAEWARARWLYASRRVLMAPPANAQTVSDFPTAPLSGSWTVTAMNTMLSCPFRFFCEQTLGLTPLELPDTGIDPRMRGTVLHKILKHFTDGLTAHAPDWPADDTAARTWLEHTVDHELTRRPTTVFWRVERLRLLGNDKSPGILSLWLAQERERALKGWRMVAAETAFEGLTIAGISLKGRVDRVDKNDTAGWIVWDYKSGNAPSVSAVISMITELQLPAYLLALQHGLLPGLTLSRESFQAGYIVLKNTAGVKIVPLTSRGKPIIWTEFLPEWEKHLYQRLELPRQGRFKANPYPTPFAFHGRNSACEFCEFFNLCGYFDRKDPPPDNDANEEESGS